MSDVIIDNDADVTPAMWQRYWKSVMLLFLAAFAYGLGAAWNLIVLPADELRTTYFAYAMQGVVLLIWLHWAMIVLTRKADEMPKQVRTTMGRRARKGMLLWGAAGVIIAAIVYLLKSPTSGFSLSTVLNVSIAALGLAASGFAITFCTRHGGWKYLFSR